MISTGVDFPEGGVIIKVQENCSEINKCGWIGPK